MYREGRNTVRDFNMVVQLENGVGRDKICTEDDEIIDYQQTCEKGKKKFFLFYVHVPVYVFICTKT